MTLALLKVLGLHCAYQLAMALNELYRRVIHLHPAEGMSSTINFAQLLGDDPRCPLPIHAYQKCGFRRGCRGRGPSSTRALLWPLVQFRLDASGDH